VLDQAERALERSAGRPPRVERLQAKLVERLQTKLVQKNEVIAELMQEHVQLKKRTWGTLDGAWVPHDTRDQVVDYVNHWTGRAELSTRQLLGWLGLGTSKFHDWKHRYGKVNEQNGKVPRDWWLEDWEKRAIVDYHDRHPLEGYRRLTFKMLDDDVVAVSPASVYRVLKQANRLDQRRFLPSKKGTGFVQPLVPREHWHVDVCYINVSGTFYYLTSVLDGCSRYIVHWEIRESMTERDVETIVQRALERHPGEKPRIISVAQRAGLCDPG
jgi:putative transposase